MPTREFCEGYNAWHNGRGFEVCPFTDDNEPLRRAEWRDGWRFAQENALIHDQCEAFGYEFPQ